MKIWMKAVANPEKQIENTIAKRLDAQKPFVKDYLKSIPKRFLSPPPQGSSPNKIGEIHLDLPNQISSVMTPSRNNTSKTLDKRANSVVQNARLDLQRMQFLEKFNIVEEIDWGRKAAIKHIKKPDPNLFLKSLKVPKKELPIIDPETGAK